MSIKSSDSELSLDLPFFYFFSILSSPLFIVTPGNMSDILQKLSEWMRRRVVLHNFNANQCLFKSLLFSSSLETPILVFFANTVKLLEKEIWLCVQSKVWPPSSPYQCLLSWRILGKYFSEHVTFNRSTFPLQSATLFCQTNTPTNTLDKSLW